MFEWLTVSMVILVLVVIIGVVFLVKVIKSKKEGTPLQTNYRALFFMGICYIGSGTAIAISTENPGLYGLAALGVVFMIAGLTNRDKWDNGTE